MPWSIPVPMLAGESVSSWLTRAALAQGCDPLCLTGVVWPKWRVWTLDIDRGVPADRLKAIVTASGLNAAAFEMASLRMDMERIAGYPLSDTQVWPWLLALGSRNRQRYCGQACCPECLSADRRPYFRRDWRFAWRVGCPIHRILLVDQCPACGAPITPHQLLAADQKISLCIRCKEDLRNAPRHPVDLNTLHFQEQADAIRQQGFGTFDGTRVTVPTWFSIAMLMVKMVRLAARSDAPNLAKAIRSLRIVPMAGTTPRPSLMFEILSVTERQWMLQVTAALMRLTVRDWVELYERYEVTQSALRQLESDLPWPFDSIAVDPAFAKSVKKNASRSPSPPKPRSRRAVLSSWVRLQRRARASTT